LDVTNNTFYYGRTLGWAYDGAQVFTTPVNVTYKNNLVYAPNATAARVLVDSSGIATASNNSTDSQGKNTSPLFSTIPSTSATQLTSTDFKITSGSYAIDSGTYVAGIFRDFQDVVRTLPNDIGAIQA